MDIHDEKLMDIHDEKLMDIHVAHMATPNESGLPGDWKCWAETDDRSLWVRADGGLACICPVKVEKQQAGPCATCQGDGRVPGWLGVGIMVPCGDCHDR